MENKYMYQINFTSNDIITFLLGHTNLIVRLKAHLNLKT